MTTSASRDRAFRAIFTSVCISLWAAPALGGGQRPDRLAAPDLRLLTQPDPPSQPPPPPAAASPDGTPPPVLDDDAGGADDWIVRIEPMLFYSSPSGKLKLPSSGFSTNGNEVRVERLNLDEPRLAPAGEVHIRAGDIRFHFSATNYTVDREPTTAEDTFRLGDVEVMPGDLLDVSFEFFTAEAAIGWNVLSHDFNRPATNGGVDIVASLEVLAGVRIYDVDISVAERGGASSGVDEFFAEPIVGIRAEFDITEQFSIDVQLSGGALPLDDHSSWSIDVLLGFMWRPHPNVGVQVGWRQLAWSLSDGSGAEEFEYPGRLAGLLGGVVISF